MVGMIDNISLIGNANNTKPEVEAATKALRIREVPVDLSSNGLGSNGGGGAYQRSNPSSLSALGAGTISFTASIRHAFYHRTPGKIARVKRIVVQQVNANSVAGVRSYSMFLRHSLLSGATPLLASVLGATGAPQGVGLPPDRYNDGGGSTLNNGVLNPPVSLVDHPKLRDSHLQDNTLMQQLVGTFVNFTYVSTMMCTDGTTLNQAFGWTELQPIAAIVHATQATSYKNPMPPMTLWDTTAGDAPLELQVGEGFVITVSKPTVTPASNLDIDATATVTWELLPQDNTGL